MENIDMKDIYVLDSLQNAIRLFKHKRSKRNSCTCYGLLCYDDKSIHGISCRECDYCCNNFCSTIVDRVR